MVPTEIIHRARMSCSRWTGARGRVDCAAANGHLRAASGGVRVRVARSTSRIVCPHDDAALRTELRARLGQVVGVHLDETGARRTTIVGALELGRDRASLFVADTGRIALITVAGGAPILCSWL